MPIPSTPITPITPTPPANPVPRSWPRRLAVPALVLLLAAAGLFAWQQHGNTPTPPRFVSEPASTGPLKVVVTANGTLQPTRSVSIGSELSGTVSVVNVDVNDRVKRGQVLVELDRAKLRDQVARSRAALAQAEAKRLQALTTQTETRAALAKLEDVAQRSGGLLPARSDLDTARATYERAQADVASAVAGVADAKAALSTDETNLSKAAITSPVNGVVLTRSVEPGNAVAASLQAVTLFTLAEDLHQLQLQVAIDEADVGTVQVGQPAEFTVAAWPRRHYPARIIRVAYGSTTTDNVVTYTALLSVDNCDLSLRPGMTATVSITAAERSNVLRVPNTALRFTPQQPGGDAGKAPGGSGSLVSKLMPRPPGMGGQRRAASGPGAGNGPATNSTATRTVWVQRADGTPEAVPVVTGLSDGHLTEVLQSTLKAGQAVITDQLGAGAK